MPYSEKCAWNEGWIINDEMKRNTRTFRERKTAFGRTAAQCLQNNNSTKQPRMTVGRKFDKSIRSNTMTAQ